VGALERVGATALELPLTRQVDPADGGVALRAAAAAVRDNDWVVVTSVTAVDRFLGALRDARALGDVRVAAVGPATADALRRSGVEPDLVPAEHSARGLVEEFPDPTGAGSRRVLFPSADLAPGTIAEGLGQKGWDVHRVEAYRTAARATPEAALLERVTAADALTFTATSSVQAFMALRTETGHPVTPPAHVVCIGPTTAAAARAAGLDGVHEAWGASAQGIVDELIGHLGAGAGAGP
jgi:uroporphyrinogen-III synthase